MVLLSCTLLSLNSSWAQVSIEVKHVFSVEVNEQKRNFIMQAHGMDDGTHLFGDVAIFDSPDAMHYCFSCGKSHKLPEAIDLLASGPSCKKLSKMNRYRSGYSGCFLATILPRKGCFSIFPKLQLRGCKSCFTPQKSSVKSLYCSVTKRYVQYCF